MKTYTIISNSSSSKTRHIGHKLNWGKCKFGASETYVWYLVWHCFWSGAV